MPTSTGELTILPGHIPLFSRIETGSVVYRVKHENQFLLVSTGFLDVQPNNQVVILVDAGVLDKEVNQKRAEEAITAAQETMAKTQDQRELMMAEASLRLAMLELQIARKTHKSNV